ncbi:MAG: AAA family ATPase [Candidatus Yanofskybacteria bacterium RIFCSPHIGHO2_02_FULL_41_11]|uniref:AAA family ATPase n=1 Tax=Candidatus Yanofskybacteria bacterium RIFCSPHIGHO2_02_FULL_41_11 TaxID=1802675 RepID=A0A1F8F7C6_9BACT|nr:MAG: Replication-associated recombination protein A [Microgenomates group bacterium GW2011_GWA1_Microgenomates_45_10]OGN09042.1 MAG: AAA family ATPase [Candidatus Yanofskybacteria bacterium RIFCSPHIGHO2_02_FULL_41_11]
MEPLANKIRPVNLADFHGQEHLVGPDKPLVAAMEKGHLFSFILWGPPGVGKTTLARIYAKTLKADYYELSAVNAGKDDIRKIIENKPTKNIPGEEGLFGPALTVSTTKAVGADKASADKPKILFLDEIHRFNKAQQDYLLPFVESGKLTLIGATTENPSFEVIPALLSRCRVFVLEELSEKDMLAIIQKIGYKIPKEAEDWLIGMAGGDARQAITMLENTDRLYGKIIVKNLKNTLQSKFLRYDKKGEEHYNTVSAFIKSMRASQADAALYYLARMVEAGEDPKFIARRMVIFASEDIGMEDPHALAIANSVFQAVDTIGMPEAGINLAHGIVYLCRCPKSKASYEAYQLALEDAKKYGNLPVPMSIRNAPTKLMRDLGYGKGYTRYPKEDLLPEKLKGKKYLKS